MIGFQQDDAFASPTPTLATLTDGPPAELQPVTFDSPRDYRLVAVAIEDRAATLKKLAKNTEDEGYPREARLIKDDATRLGEDLLAPFKAQMELPLATAEELGAGIQNELRGLVRHHAREATEKVDHEAVLLKALGERVGAFVREVATTAFAAGVAYRETTPEVLALRALDRLRPGA